MLAFTATLSRILHAIATDGTLHANSFIDQQRLDIAARVLRNPRNFKIQYDPLPHSAYQAVLAAQQSIFAAALLARLIFCRATPARAQQMVDSELLTRHIEHQQNYLLNGLIVHIDTPNDRISVGTFEESAALAFQVDPPAIRDLAAALLNAQLPLAA